MSIFTIPVKQLVFKKLFVRMWSNSSALGLVILVGLFITGIKGTSDWDNTLPLYWSYNLTNLD